MITLNRATIDDLYRIKSKAELVNGELITEMPTGGMPANAGFEIAFSLKVHIRQVNLPGIAVPDNAGFLVNLSNRQSFSQDAAYYVGPPPSMEYYNGAPQFAAEVRSENDCFLCASLYGQATEIALALKRQDDFAAGTQVVWEVDLQGEEVVKVYRAPTPHTPTIYRRGEIAEAEPAVPGWTMAVDELFP